MLDMPIKECDYLSFRLVATQVADHPLRDVWDSCKKGRYDGSKPENVRKYRTTLELIRESYERPDLMQVLADFLEDSPYQKWAPILRQSQTLYRLFMAFQFAGARARHYCNGLRRSIDDLAFKRANARTQQEREQFLVQERPGPGPDEDAEVYGYPWKSDLSCRYVPEGAWKYQVRRWPHHTCRLMMAGLDGYRVPSDIADDLANIIDKVGSDLRKYRLLPWWGFKL